MVYIETQYKDYKTGHMMDFKFPRVHLNDKMNLNEEIVVNIQSNVYGKEKRGRNKSWTEYEIKVIYDNREMYAILTPVLKSKIEQLPMGTTVKITKKQENGKIMMQCDVLGQSQGNLTQNPTAPLQPPSPPLQNTSESPRLNSAKTLLAFDQVYPQLIANEENIKEISPFANDFYGFVGKVLMQGFFDEDGVIIEQKFRASYEKFMRDFWYKVK